VGINPILSDLNIHRTSELGWRYFEAIEIDRNELQICKNSLKGTRTKMTEKLNNFEKFERKSSPKGFSASKCDVRNWIFSKSWEFFGNSL
jgi:hypothetical protein